MTFQGIIYQLHLSFFLSIFSFHQQNPSSLGPSSLSLSAEGALLSTNPKAKHGSSRTHISSVSSSQSNISDSFSPIPPPSGSERKRSFPSVRGGSGGGRTTSAFPPRSSAYLTTSTSIDGTHIPLGEARTAAPSALPKAASSTSGMKVKSQSHIRELFRKRQIAEAALRQALLLLHRGMRKIFIVWTRKCGRRVKGCRSFP